MGDQGLLPGTGSCLPRASMWKAGKSPYGVVHPDQCCGVGAGDWLLFVPLFSGGKGFVYKEGVDASDDANPFRGIKSTDRRSVAKLLSWVQANNPAQLDRVKPAPDDTRPCTDDPNMLALIRRLMMAARQEKAKSAQAWDLIYQNARANLREAELLRDVRGGSSSAAAESQSATAVRASRRAMAEHNTAASSAVPPASTAVPPPDAKFAIVAAAAMEWHGQAKRVVFSEDSGVPFLNKYADTSEGDFEKVLATMDYVQVSERAHRHGTVGAEAKLNEPELQETERDGVVLCIEFTLDDKQQELFRKGLLKWTALMIWWRGLFVWDHVLIPMSMLKGEQAFRAMYKGRFRFELALGISGKLASRVVTNPLHRHMWLNKYMYGMRHVDSRVRWIERPLDSTLGLH